MKNPEVLVAAIYFMVAFGGLTLWLLWRLSRAHRTEDEKLKSKILLKGMTAHFAYSIVMLLIYWQVAYRENVLEVWIALITYSISFVAYIRAALRIK